MLLLLLVSLLWAFSPGLIKHFLGDLPSPAVATVRLGLTFLVFAPLLNPRRIARSTATWLAGIGAIQFGVMYLLYLQAFKFLQGHEVYLFTIFTPIYVVLLDAALTKKIGVRHMIAAVLSVIGAGVVIQRSAGTANVMIGFLLVQGANLCFAAGQIAYKKTRPALAHISDAVLFSWLALGGFVTTAVVAAPALGFSLTHFSPTPQQWLVLAFLGLIASGAGFFMWNRGLTQVNAGTLAALNNAKIPLGVLVSLLVFHEPAHVERLSISLVLLVFAVLLAEWKPRLPAEKKAGP